MSNVSLVPFQPAQQTLGEVSLSDGLRMRSVMEMFAKATDEDREKAQLASETAMLSTVVASSAYRTTQVGQQLIASADSQEEKDALRSTNESLARVQSAAMRALAAIAEKQV